MAVGNPTGATITFGTSSFSANIIETIDWSGIERAVIETTHFGSTLPSSARQVGGKTFIPGKLVDPGELTLQIQYDPTLDLPLGSADVAETITLTPPSGMSSNTITCSGFMRSARIGLPLEGLATATVVVKFTGIASTPST
jgi:hypothetical protein